MYSWVSWEEKMHKKDKLHTDISLNPLLTFILCSNSLVLTVYSCDIVLSFYCFASCIVLSFHRVAWMVLSFIRVKYIVKRKCGSTFCIQIASIRCFIIFFCPVSFMYRVSSQIVGFCVLILSFLCGIHLV